MTMQPRDAHSSPEDEETSTRKRVCKACDRCRLKKSKVSISRTRHFLPGSSNPCSAMGRVRVTDASQITPSVCLESGRSHTTRSIPKGGWFYYVSDRSCSSFCLSYVEMLEQQQDKLVNALQELYDRNLKRKAWTGPPLNKTSKGIPLTHDILNALGMLKLDDQGNCERFEENPDVLRNKMIIKEEDAYPTPTMIQGEYTPFGDNFEPYASMPFSGEKGPPGPRYTLTPPMQSPEADMAMNFPESSSMNVGTGISLGPTSLQQPSQAWTPTGSRYGPEMEYTYDVSPLYSGMNVMEQKGGPCLPLPWEPDEDIGFNSLSSWRRLLDGAREACLIVALLVGLKEMIECLALKVVRNTFMRFFMWATHRILSLGPCWCGVMSLEPDCLFFFFFFFPLRDLLSRFVRKERL